ncbi:MAG TPA: SprB repeat-containing protein [Bacteroidia bacterium]|nr:SprB repeat-containing protein [Bacteroidia bacterium]HRH08750.1 SprB repeat-containing protein [Bacteroidia bacterium]
MKKLSMIFRCFLLLYFTTITLVKAEEFDVQLTPSLYAGGYNISCNGTNNGSINLFISGGTAPYTYVWLDGPTVRNRSNLAAGYYRVVVTSSNGLSVTREITLTQPDVFQVILSPTEYEGGYHISENGGNNGIIVAEVLGGVPPYSYLWSNGGSTIDRITDLTAGPYSLTVHDATNCTTTASVTLIEPTVFQLVSISSPTVVGNYNIGCNLPGSINVNVAGGTPPYTFEWEHGPNTQNLNEITEAGDYAVLIRDENGSEIRTNITLTRAPEVSANATAFVFPNSKNTSCNTCTNGSININITSGTPPYTYAWNNGASVQNPNNLGAGVYLVVITDAAGCITEKTAILTAPEREDWTMNGNTGTNPATQFIGTSDNKDLVFKRMNIETMRFDTSGTRFEKLLTAKGGIALNAAQTLKILYSSTSTGESFVRFGQADPAPIPLCFAPNFNGVNPDPIYSFNGFMASKPDNPVGSTNAALIFGSAPWNGDGLIEVEGTDNNGGTSNGLLINYFCGRDVAICANPAAGGVVSTGNNFEVGHPYPRDIGIAVNIRGTSKNGMLVSTLTGTTPGDVDPEYNTLLQVGMSETKILKGTLLNTGGWYQDVFSIKGDGETYFGNPTNPAFYIKPIIDGGTFQYLNANVGIGTNNPQAKLDVEGDIRISSLNNNSSVFNLIQADSDGKLSKVSTSSFNSLGLWETNGSGVFRQVGRVGIGLNNPGAFLDVVAPTGEEGLKVTTTSDPNFNTLLISSAMSTKIISGFLNMNNTSNEVFSIKSDGNTIFGNPIQPALFITPLIDNGNTYLSGNIGIGTNLPTKKLTVNGDVQFLSDNSINSFEILLSDNAKPSRRGITIDNDPSGKFNFYIHGWQSNASFNFINSDPGVLNPNLMTINSNGKVGIGNPTSYPGDYNLYVTGGIITEKLKIALGTSAHWQDVVFDSDYNLRSIDELESFIANNKHLPGIPTTSEVEKNGIDVAIIETKLLQKVEELTLYIIQQNKRIIELESKINRK